MIKLKKILIEKIEGIRKNIKSLHPWPEHTTPEADYDKGFNLGIDEAIELIKKEIISIEN